MNQSSTPKLTTPVSKISIELNEEIDSTAFVMRIGIALGLAYTLFKVVTAVPIEDVNSHNEQIEVQKILSPDSEHKEKPVS